MKQLYTLLFFILFSSLSLAQNESTAVITGKVTDALTDRPVDLVLIYIEGTSNAVETSTTGRYRIEIPANQKIKLIFSRIGYKESSVAIDEMPARTSKQVDVSMAGEDSDIEVIVRESKIEEAGMVKEEVTQLKLLPTTTGNFESVLPHIALGTSGGTGGELSSQYNVRGGNYDENLVYVNDFEIYRPQLITSRTTRGFDFSQTSI